MKTFTLAAFLTLCPLLINASGLSAQETNAANTTDDIDVIEMVEADYKPHFDGAVKARFEVSTFDGQHRFNVRHSRFGVSGDLSPNMFYRIQVEFSNEGKIATLDSYVGYKTGNFEFTLGQQPYRFSTDLIRGPAQNMFANRSFLAKYLMNYYGAEISDGKVRNTVSNMGARDLGAQVSYRFNTAIPIRAFLGVFNGTGINNPQWDDYSNIVGRLELGGAEGFRAAVSYYTGLTPKHSRIFNSLENLPVNRTVNSNIEMLGAELRYISGNFFIESEYAQRAIEEETRRVLTAAHVISYYKFPLAKNKCADYIAPIARWDIGDNVDYLNTDTNLRETFTANRATIGVNFGFAPALLQAEIRLNYEKYFIKKQPSDFANNKLLQDKFTIEFVASF